MVNDFKLLLESYSFGVTLAGSTTLIVVEALFKAYSDSFKANEVKNFGVCRIRLQEWALPSDGYTATLKRKTEGNH